jgi:hypothetical protein
MEAETDKVAVESLSEVIERMTELLRLDETVKSEFIEKVAKVVYMTTIATIKAIKIAKEYALSE